MRSSELPCHKRLLSVTSAFILTASLMMVAVIGGGGIMPAMTTTTQQQVFAQQPADGDGETPPQAGEGQQTAANTT
ncbi:MAG: hypothetical protein M3251_03265 [Thermoproteota archaeon]|nr:hypothetical protein [Thermoproteota archaeon]